MFSKLIDASVIIYFKHESQIIADLMQIASNSEQHLAEQNDKAYLFQTSVQALKTYKLKQWNRAESIVTSLKQT